jgi:steroid 5-alpha reductase family enzyme
MRSDRPIGLLDLAGVGISLAGAIIEGVADEQLRSHRHAAKGAICDVGLWRYSRHPNYFGECLFWLGLFVLGLAAEPGDAWYAVSGVVVIVGLFLFYSIPAAERRSLARRAAYGEHQKRVSAFIPWFRTR